MSKETDKIASSFQIYSDIFPVQVDCCKIVGGFQIKERPQLMEDCVNECCNSPGSSKYSFHNLDSDGKRISLPNSK